jgi:hypothetical protein
MVLVPLPYGEIVDRVVILELKCAKIADPAHRAQARALRDELLARWTTAGLPPMETVAHHGALETVNAALWDVEDALREHERAGTFDAEFVRLAREVYKLNDRRAASKRAIDVALGSVFSEPKSHPLQTGT